MQPDKSNVTETLFSGPMLRELRRRIVPARVIVIPRWAGWARSMTERHRIVDTPRSAQSMTFLHSPALVRLHERLTNFSLNFYSRIHLAIQPVLRELRLGDSKAWRSGIGQLEGARGRSPGDLNSIHLRRARVAGDATGDFELRSLNELRPARERSTSSPALAGADNAPSPPNSNDHSITNIEGLSRGLPLVFQRLREFDDSIIARPTSGAGDVAGQTLRLVNRSQRVEQSILPSVAEVARFPVPATPQQAASQVASSEHTAAQTIGTFRVPQEPWRANPPQVPEAIVEQLTERVIRQIDQRTIAWRERMGKI